MEFEKENVAGRVALKARSMNEPTAHLPQIRDLRNWVDLRQEKSWSILYCFGMNVG